MYFDINLSSFFNNFLKKNKKISKIYKENLKKCLKAADRLIIENKNKSNEILNSFSLEYQKKNHFISNKLKVKKKQLIIGFGGSAAGTKSISSIIGSSTYFFDNYDPNYINSFFKKNNLNDFTIYVISKSGKTNETLAILNLTYAHLLKISKPNIIKKNIIVIVENTNNFLRNFAIKMGFKIIEHNKKIGGRFSCFSETSMTLFNFNPSLVPSVTNQVMHKLNIKKNNDHSSPAVNAAMILTMQQINKINLNINILYNYSLKNYSYWYHQLFAESLGKDCKGMTPITSICPKDHHSMMQLYIDGPKDKFFNIFLPDLNVSFQKFSCFNLGIIEKFSPPNFLKEQCSGLIKTFRNEKIAHRVFSFKNFNKNKLKCILQLMSYMIIETLIIGYAQNINPYNQPAVERIKKNTFNF